MTAAMTKQAKEVKDLTVLDYGDDAGAGYENQDSSDTAIPMIVLLQPQSPAVLERRKDPETGVAAAPGFWYNSVTGHIREVLHFVPATTKHVYVEWTPRDEGGGYRGQHDISSKVVQQAIAESKNFGEYFMPAVQGEPRNILQETFYVFGVVCNGEQPEGMAMLSFWSTKIKAYKTWMSRIKAVRVTAGENKIAPPLYAHLTALSSELKKFGDGSAYVPVIQPADPRGVVASLLGKNDERFQMAKACRELIAGGLAKINYDAENEPADKSEDVPF